MYVVFVMYFFNMTASLPDKSAVMEETDQELNSPAQRPKSSRPKSAMAVAVQKGP